MSDSQQPQNRVDQNRQEGGEDNTQQSIGHAENSTIKAHETNNKTNNIYMDGIALAVVALALVILVGILALRSNEATVNEVPLTLAPTPIPSGAQNESYLFYVDVSENMNKVIGGKVAYEWTQDVIAGILNRISIQPDRTRSGLLKVGGGTGCNQVNPISFERGRPAPLTEFLGMLQQSPPGGESAYTSGFSEVMNYFENDPQEKKYLFIFMGAPYGTTNCYRQDIIDLPGLIQDYSDYGIDVELCAFSFFSDLGEYNRMRNAIEDYGIECVQNVTNEVEAAEASSVVVRLISNNRILPVTAVSPLETTTSVVPTQITTPNPNPSTTPIITSCSDGLPVRLAPGMQGRVRSDDPRPLNVRSGPATSFSRVGQIAIGSVFDVIEGPTCNENLAWFRIAYSNGFEGWIAEGDETYFVDPLEVSIQRTPLPLIAVDRRLAPTCDVVLEDEFRGGTSRNDWFEDRSVDTQLVEDFYEMRVNRRGINEASISGSLRGVDIVDARVEAVITTSTFSTPAVHTGMRLRYQNEVEYLAFMISSTGSYRIARSQSYLVDQAVAWRTTDLVLWTETSALRVGDGVVNTLRVDSQGSRFDFYINGQYITTVTDDTWPSGGFAFWGSSSNPPTSFYLDYLRICEL